MSDQTASSRIERILGTLSLGNLRLPIGIILTVVLLRPVLRLEFVLGGDYIATTIVIWMLFAAAYNLLLGYTGLLSFGHAMFLGAGLYGVAIGISRFGLPYLVAAPIGIVVAAALAYGIGRLSVHRGEIYFAMITLAFGAAAHFIVNANPLGLTGGANGIRSEALPAWIEGVRGQTFVAFGEVRFQFYYLAAAVFFVAMLLLWQIVRSPFGRTLVAIRDNEELARAMGISPQWYKIRAFTLSGAFSALAGTLLVINNGGAALEDIGVLESGNVLLMTIFGGMNYFFGPIAGVFSWYTAREWLTGFETLHFPLSEFSLVSVELGHVLEYWQFFFGLAFVILVLIAPQSGIWGFVRGRVLAGVVMVRRWIDDV